MSLRVRWNHIRDYPGNVRARTGTGIVYRAHVAASNAWYRVAGRRISGARMGVSNWRNQRTLERGRRPRTTQAADAARSSVPLYRDRINPGTGRPHRDDRQLGRTSDASLARMAPRVRADRAARPGRSPR